MGVAAEHQGPVDPLRGAVLHDRLRDGDDVRLVEGAVEAGPPVPGGPEHHLLRRIVGVGDRAGVGIEQRIDVDQVLGAGGLSCVRVVSSHEPSL